jgi:hypothetical protein
MTGLRIVRLLSQREHPNNVHEKEPGGMASTYRISPLIKKKLATEAHGITQKDFIAFITCVSVYFRGYLIADENFMQYR